MSKLETTAFALISTPSQSKQPSKQPPTPTGQVKPSSMVYWTRFALAVSAGITANLLRLKSDPIPIILVAGAFYAVSVALVRYVFRYGEKELKTKHGAYSLGWGTFVMVFLFITVLLYTLNRY